MQLGLNAPPSPPFPPQYNERNSKHVVERKVIDVCVAREHGPHGAPVPPEDDQHLLWHARNPGRGGRGAMEGMRKRREKGMKGEGEEKPREGIGGFPRAS